MDPEVVVLRAENAKKAAEHNALCHKILGLTRKNVELAAELRRLRMVLRNYELREDSHNRKRKQVDLIHDENEVNEELSGQDALDQIQAYKRVAREKSLHVGGLDFRAGRLVPDRRVRLAAIVRKLGPFVQGGGQSGQEQVECLD
jgi:hypothetical protein